MVDNWWTRASEWVGRKLSRCAIFPLVLQSRMLVSVVFLPLSHALSALPRRGFHPTSRVLQPFATTAGTHYSGCRVHFGQTLRASTHASASDTPGRRCAATASSLLRVLSALASDRPHPPLYSCQCASMLDSNLL
ncbi:hypothetical protein K438DRAFT_200678 [Mycena galopus ATCC 62051]|nr:hypothetical protein K438DRAFT_200678 [Mycena galopus ATCC 62051]